MTEREPAGLPCGADVARGQLRRVGAHAAHADRDGVDLRAQLVHAAARLLAGDPARPGNGDAAVERQRELEHHERPPLRNPRAPRLVLCARGEEVGVLDVDAGRAQDVEASCRFRVRVTGAGDDFRHARRDERVGARRRRAVVGTRLHRHVQRRAARAPARRLQRDDLGVRAALPLVPALADDLAVAHEHGADDRIRMCRAAPSLGELERTFDVHASSCTNRR